MQVAKLIENAKTLGHQTQTAAWAVELTAKRPAYSLCCWCLETHDPEHRTEVYRLPHGGDCAQCSYSGRDCLVVVG
jgi:hypothetical protein